MDDTFDPFLLRLDLNQRPFDPQSNALLVWRDPWRSVQAPFPALLQAFSVADAPAITGGAAVGSVLSCSQGAWAPDLLGSFLYRAPQGFAYQWSLGGADIAGATQNFHTAAAPGSYACRVTAKNQAGSTPQTSARLAVAPTPACVVPKLKGKKLKAAKKRLRNANCKLGKVKGPGGGKVKNQGPKPGAVQLRPA